MDSCSECSFKDGSMGKDVIIFGPDMRSSIHIDNKNKDILILDEGPTQGLDDITLTSGAKYLINFTQLGKKLVLSLHYNESNSFLFINITKIYQFKAKDSEKDVTIDNMKKIGLKGVAKFFSVDFSLIDTNDILDIHKYLMKKNII